MGNIGTGVIGGALQGAGVGSAAGPYGSLIGAVLGAGAGLMQGQAANRKRSEFEARDAAIPLNDPVQQGFLNRLAQQERQYRIGMDPNTALANRLTQQSGAQTQANLARAGGPGLVQNLLSSQNVTNRGLAASAAQAAGMADNMLGMQGQLVNLMAQRRYDRQRYRRDLALMESAQQQQNINNQFSAGLSALPGVIGSFGGMGGGARASEQPAPVMGTGGAGGSFPETYKYANATPASGGSAPYSYADPYAIPSATLDQNLTRYGR